MAEKQIKEIFLKFLTEDLNCSAENRFLLAVSGGVDSMSMLSLFRSCHLNFEVAHVNFGLRGEESDEEERFIRSYCEKNSIKAHFKRFKTNEVALEDQISIQMAARELRYEWFDEIRKENNLDFTCTGHHLNDFLETTVFNLIKGSGISGIAGVLPRKGNLIRPMACFTRFQLFDYACEIKLDWREDSSNKDTKYHRNYIRHTLLPLWDEINPNYVNTFRDTAERLRAARSLVMRTGEEVKSRAVEEIKGGEVIHKYVLREYSLEEAKLIMAYMLEPYGFNYKQVQDIVLGLNQQSGKLFYSNKFEVVNDREVYYLMPIPEENDVDEEVVLSAEDTVFEFARRNFAVRTFPKPENWRPDYSRIHMHFDADKVKYPLTVRRWKAGDVFVPLGMKGKKKISDFMIDRKIPVNFKSQVPVLLCKKSIIGLIGHEISNTVRVTDKTKTILEFHELYEKSV